MSTVAITGVGGALGRRLVAALDDVPEIERVIGLDRRAPAGVTSSKLVFRDLDVRDAALRDVLRDVDVVVHLAFQLDPIRDLASMRAVNVEGTQAVLEAARQAGVHHVVYTSSVLVYGARSDNDFPLTEDSPLRGVPDFPYAEHELEVERWIWPWVEQAEGPRVAVLRLAPLLGPGVDNFMTRPLEAPRIPVVKGHRPPLQFLHPDDAASAVAHVVQQRLEGAFNVGAEGWLSFDEVTAIVGRNTVEIPEEVAYSGTSRLWQLGLAEQPPGLLALWLHPWVMSSAKLVQTGWRPQHTNRDAVASMAAEHAPYVALLGVRTRWSTVRRGAATVALLFGFAVWRAWRAWSRRRAGRAERDAR